MRKWLAALLVVVCSGVAHATVLTTSRSTDYTGTGTSTFAFTWPIISTADVTVTKYTGACGSATYTVLTAGSHYSVVKSRSGGGTVTTTSPVAAGYCLRVQRIVDLKQTTSFITQGTFSAPSHEAAFDKLTMEVQQLADGVGVSEETSVALENHIASADDHTGYAKLAGRAGGQRLNGATSGAPGPLQLAAGPSSTAYMLLSDAGLLLTGDTSVFGSLLLRNTTVGSNYTLTSPTLRGSTSAGGNLSLSSTANATKGKVDVDGFVYFDGVNQYVGIGTATPLYPLHVTGSALIGGIIYGDTDSGGRLDLRSTTHATKGYIYLGTGSAFDEQHNMLGIGTSTPSVGLDVVGNARVSGTITARTKSATKTADYTVSAPYDCGSTLFLNPAGVDGHLIITLPDVTSSLASGCSIRLILASATTDTDDIGITPDASDLIAGNCTYDTDVTGATADANLYQHDGTTGSSWYHLNGRKGDRITLVNDGTATWYVTDCAGGWGKYSGGSLWLP